MMKKIEAIGNLQISGRLLVAIGIIGLIGTSVFWNSEEDIISLFKIVFSVGFIYFGYLILSSTRALAKTP